MSFSLVVDTEKASADGSDVTTDAVDTTGADLLILGLAGTSDFSSHPTDSKSNTWNALTAQAVGGGERSIIYYAKNPTVGSGHTFSLSTVGKLPAICAAAFSGAHLTTPFDQENGGDNFGSTCQPGSITPGEDNELIITSIAFNVSGTFTINGGFTITGQVDKAVNSIGCALAYLIQTSAAAANPTWTHSPGSSSMAARIASFKVAGGGGGFVPGSNVRLAAGTHVLSGGIA